jgi:hypothetical protein
MASENDLTPAEQALIEALKQPPQPAIQQALSNHRQQLIAELEAEERQADERLKADPRLMRWPQQASIAASFVVGLLTFAIYLSNPAPTEQASDADWALQLSEIPLPETQAPESDLGPDWEPELVAQLSELSEVEWQMVQELEFVWWLEEQSLTTDDLDQAG